MILFELNFFIMSYNCMQPSILDSRTIKGSQPKMSFLLCCVSGNVSCDSSRFYRADRQTRVKTLLGLPAALIFCPLSSLFCKLQTTNLCWMWLWLSNRWSQLVSLDLLCFRKCELRFFTILLGRQLDKFF